MKTYRILAINPGSTTTKIAVFDNKTEIFKVTLEHSSQELDKFKDLSEQKPYRMEKIKEVLREKNIALESIDAFVGRGGGQEAMEGGTYTVNDLAYEHARIGYRAVHPVPLAPNRTRPWGSI